MDKTQANNPDIYRLTVNVPNHIALPAKDLAEFEGSTLSDLVRRLMVEYLDRRAPNWRQMPQQAPIAS